MIQEQGVLSGQSKTLSAVRSAEEPEVEVDGGPCQNSSAVERCFGAVVILECHAGLHFVQHETPDLRMLPGSSLGLAQDSTSAGHDM